MTRQIFETAQHMSFTMDRRRRRRWRFLTLSAVVVALLIAGWAVTRIQSDEQVRRAFLDSAIAVADGSSDVADDFVDLIVGLDNLEREALVSGLEDIKEEMTVEAQAIADIAAPEAQSLQRAGILLEIAVASWDEGITETVDGILLLTASQLDPQGLALLTNGLVELRVGDDAYAGFLEEIGEADTSLLERDFPTVTFIPPGQELVFEPSDIATRLILSETLGPVLNLAVADLRINPSPVGEEQGIPVVPLSEGFDAFVTISNRGNVDAEQIRVEFLLVSSDGTSFPLDRTIEALGPGELQSLLFDDLPVEPGTIYEIIVELPDPDDDPDDDRANFVFMRDAEE